MDRHQPTDGGVRAGAHQEVTRTEDDFTERDHAHLIVKTSFDDSQTGARTRRGLGPMSTL
jgi:hypothetical protein